MIDIGTTVISIMVICYLLGQGIKATPLPDKWIPFTLGCLGAALGVAGMYVIPDFPAGNVMDALCVGICSAWASTGLHQTIKQSAAAGEDE